MTKTPGEKPDPSNSAPDGSNPEELARVEKKAARRISLGNHAGLLIGALALWLVSLALPVTSEARGFEVLVLTLPGETGATLAEFIHSVLVFLGVGLFNLLLLITRRTIFSWLAWLFTGIGLFYSLFALWMRQTQSNENMVGIGLYVSILAVLLATYALSSVILRRDPDQVSIAEERASSDNLDAVGRAQRAATSARAEADEVNPLLVDDRRSRAAERYRNRRPGPDDEQS
ncbi:hypothetical protein [Corynebacterium halotolerans]|uniref:Rv2732c family membrane protein n=1 Tax=Corynebacterium halotolerans TaxID=225326 RepID=UPI003CE7426F